MSDSLRIANQKRSERSKRFKALVSEAKAIVSVCDLEVWFRDNLPEIYETFPHHDMRSGQMAAAHLDVRRFSFRVTWSDLVSNSHCSPRGKPKNFSRDESKPFGYPGWTGVLECDVSDGGRWFISSILQKFDIHTGTGGQRYGYSVRWFADDWPMLAVYERLKRSA